MSGCISDSVSSLRLSSNDEKGNAKRTLVAYQKDATTMFGNAQSMVLHAGRPANVSQDHDLNGSALLEVQRLTSILHFDGDVIATVVDKLERLVEVRIILRGQRQQDYGEKHRQHDDDTENNLKAMIEGVGEELFAEHDADRCWGGCGPVVVE
jgi:hypothetical protein